jgi:chemotaxis signal transduction protein
MKLRSAGDDHMSRQIGQVCGIVFRLDDGWFFVDIMRVREIIRPPELGMLVSMPTFVAGMMTLRGVVVPVLNLRERFDLPGHAAEPQSRILVLSTPGQLIGILVDEATGVLTLSVDAIQPPPSLMTSRVAPFFIGIASVRERIISLVNIDRLLSPEEQRTLVTLAQPGPACSGEGVPCS